MFHMLLDFEDNVVSKELVFKNHEDLAEFLQRIPSMLGFAINGVAHITIRHTPSPM